MDQLTTNQERRQPPMRPRAHINHDDGGGGGDSEVDRGGDGGSRQSASDEDEAKGDRGGQRDGNATDDMISMSTATSGRHGGVLSLAISRDFDQQHVQREQMQNDDGAVVRRKDKKAGSISKGVVEFDTREQRQEPRTFTDLVDDGVGLDGIDVASGSFSVASSESYGSGGSGECGLFYRSQYVVFNVSFGCVQYWFGGGPLLVSRFRLTD